MRRLRLAPVFISLLIPSFFLLWVLTMKLTAATPTLAELNRMIARFAPAELKVDTSKLTPGDQQALRKLIEAAKVLDRIFLDQRWKWNSAA